MQTNSTVDYDTLLDDLDLPEDLRGLLQPGMTAHTRCIGDFLGRSEDVLIRHHVYGYRQLEWLYQRLEEFGLTREGARQLGYGYGKRQQRRAAARRALNERGAAQREAMIAKLDAMIAALDDDG